jgi:hypothetical protein
MLEKKWEYNEAVRHLFIDFKKAYDSVRREVLYNILIELGIPMKLVRPDFLQMSHTTDTLISSQPLQHPPEPDSVILKMKAACSSETLQHTPTAWCRNPKDHQVIH